MTFKTLNPLEKRKIIIDQAQAVVEGERQVNYGSPEDNFKRIASLWEAYLIGRKQEQLFVIDEKDVAMMMVLMKIARLMNNPNHWDSIKDGIGYFSCLASLVPDENCEL